MAKITLKILTPEETVFEGEVDEILVETDNGQMGILPNHVDLICTLIPGELRIKQNGKSIVMATGAGMLEVGKLEVGKNEVSILTDLAKDGSDINEKEVQVAHDRAKAALEEKTLSDEEYADTLAVLERSLVMLKVKHKHTVR